MALLIRWFFLLDRAAKRKVYFISDSIGNYPFLQKYWTKN